MLDNTFKGIFYIKFILLLKLFSELSPRFVSVIKRSLFCKNLLTFFKETPVERDKSSTEIALPSDSLKKFFN